MKNYSYHSSLSYSELTTRKCVKYLRVYLNICTHINSYTHIQWPLLRNVLLFCRTLGTLLGYLPEHTLFKYFPKGKAWPVAAGWKLRNFPALLSARALVAEAEAQALCHKQMHPFSQTVWNSTVSGPGGLWAAPAHAVAAAEGYLWAHFWRCSYVYPTPPNWC